MLHTPSITQNLLGVSKFTKDNLVFFEFHPNVCFAKDQVIKKVLLLQGFLKDGLYAFHLPLQLSQSILIASNPVQSPSPSNFVFLSNKISSCTNKISIVDLWDKRLGHPAFPIIKNVLNRIFVTTSDVLTPCVVCLRGKSHKLPFKSSNTVYFSPLQLIQADVQGSFAILSSRGFKYYGSFIDAYSKFV